MPAHKSQMALPMKEKQYSNLFFPHLYIELFSYNNAADLTCILPSDKIEQNIFRYDFF
ncbi:MAG: hypothetical protein RL642_943 [Bacteroidota bacterium]